VRLTPSLQVRPRITGTNPTSAAAPQPSGPLAIIRQLDDDVTTYVARNDLRERVRGFVHEAILRLACRDDVSHLVVNAHSQGTVLAYDVLREMPPFAAAKVQHLVTAGSPLRKYVDLFYWGTDASGINTTPWSNFWDATDPVADPLEPPRSWRLGDPVPPSSGVSQLYTATDPDTGHTLPVPLRDTEVSNAAHGAGGGLPAHNYWDNDAEFVRPLADILRGVTAG